MAGRPLPADLGQRAWLEVDLDALAHNLRLLRSLADGARLAPVVKADGYGHGIEAVSRTLERAGAAALCVATLDEAILVRAAGVRIPILLLYPAPAGSAGELRRLGVEPPVSTLGGIADLAAGPDAAGPGLRIHLEIETGLTRMGVLPEEAGEAARRIAASAGLGLAGVWSHIADPGDPERVAAQVAALERAVAAVEAATGSRPERHLAASGGLLAGGIPRLELVRPGIAVYGVLPDGLVVPPERTAAAAALRPVLSLRARPIRILDVPAGTAVSYGGRWVAPVPSRIATVPVGYGDGYARTTGPGAEVLVRGQRAPVVGTIAMDALMVDLTAIPEAGMEDEVVLLGEQGGDRIGAHDLAARRGTIAWEVLSTFGRRLPRLYRAQGGDGLRALAHARPEGAPDAG